jgi:hypothetical protein
MYSLGSLIVELQTARRSLLNVFELPVGTATSGRRTYGMRNELESTGRLTRIKSSMDVLRLTTAAICTPKDRDGAANLITIQALAWYRPV